MSSSQVQRRHRLSSLGLNRLLSIAKEAGAQVTQTMAGSDIVDAIIAVEEQFVFSLFVVISFFQQLIRCRCLWL